MSSNCTSTTAVAVAPLSASKTKTKKKHFVCQKVKLFRASEPILSVLMWGVNHTVTSSPARAPSPQAATACTPTPPLHAVGPGALPARHARPGVPMVCGRLLPSPCSPSSFLCSSRAARGAQREGLRAVGLRAPVPSPPLSLAVAWVFPLVPGCPLPALVQLTGQVPLTARIFPHPGSGVGVAAPGFPPSGPPPPDQNEMWPPRAEASLGHRHCARVSRD